MEWSVWLGKRIFVRLKTSLGTIEFYSGVVNEVNTNHISIIDKYNNKVTFAVKDIELIKEDLKNA